MAFSQYLKNIEFPYDDCLIDADSFRFDVSQGLKFESSIPQGFGVGSSGALCSAIFRRYGQAPMALTGQPKKDEESFCSFRKSLSWRVLA